jgi:hypothetical protein
MNFEQDGADRNYQDRQVGQELHDRSPPLNATLGITQPFRAGSIVAFWNLGKVRAAAKIHEKSAAGSAKLLIPP